jgi:hypothetical protein
MGRGIAYRYLQVYKINIVETNNSNNNMRNNKKEEEEQ